MLIVVCTPTGIGVAAGAFLLTSGLSDIYKGVVGAIKGEFDMVSHLQGKAIEIGVAIITCGIGGTIAKAPSEVFKTIVKDFIIDAASTEIPKLLRKARLDGLADVSGALFGCEISKI